MFAFSTNTLTDGLSRQESKLASSKISLKISALFKLKSLSLSPLVGLFLAFTLVGCGGGGGGGVDRNNPITSADAKAPTITSQPQSATYTKGATPNALTVSAEVDAGVLSYQWHSNSVDNNESGTEIRGEVANTFTPPTDVVGETYYYVVVTNTNPAATGAKTA
ncbi:MAG: hypothetical protein LBQ18_00715, partial [Campylobacteraceae bacterium]|nr:hypothetical protein [Campylobacteraceae bacterium]